MRNYTIKGLIGKGAFGKVYLVQHNLSKRHYAMKTLRKD